MADTAYTAPIGQPGMGMGKAPCMWGTTVSLQLGILRQEDRCRARIQVLSSTVLVVTISAQCSHVSARVARVRVDHVNIAAINYQEGTGRGWCPRCFEKSGLEIRNALFGPWQQLFRVNACDIWGDGFFWTTYPDDKGGMRHVQLHRLWRWG